MRNATGSIFAWLLTAGLLAVSTTGCARDTRTVRSDSSVVQTTPAAPAGSAVVTEQHSVYTHHEDDDAPRGVLSTVVHFVGEVLALPFRVVGGLLRAIF